MSGWNPKDRAIVLDELTIRLGADNAAKLIDDPRYIAIFESMFAELKDKTAEEVATLYQAQIGHA